PEWCQGVKVLFAKVTNIAALAEPLSFEWYQGMDFLGDGQELLVTANGTYTVIVTDDNGCSTTVSKVVNYDLSTLLSAHTIIVDDQLDMDESTVVSGGVGVQDGDEVSVQHNSNIMTFMRSAAAQIDGSSTVANYINSDSPVNLPAFMSNPYLDNNNQIITGNVTLSGTNYGNVYVKSGATLTIGNGEMYMKSLTMAKGSTLNFNEDCNLKIRAKMNIGPLCNVNVEGGPSVVVYVGDNASVGQGSIVWVDIYAPEGLKVGDSGAYLTTYMNGLFISDDLTSGDNVVWGWNLNCGDLDNGGSNCVAVGAVGGSLAPITKGVSGFCSTNPPPSTTCDCPPGYVVVGYEGLTGNSYGTEVISQFSLRCKQLNANGTLGNSVIVSCANGSLATGVQDGPVDAAPGQVMVGAQLGVGCAIDQMSGYSKPLSEVIAGSANTSSTLMPLIGGVTGNTPIVQFVPNGNVIVGMVTYRDQNPPSGYNVFGIAAGVAWRYAPVSSCNGGDNVPLAAAVNPTPESLDTPTERLANLTVFPNPSSGVVNITVEDYIGKSIELAVYNILGEQVWFKHIETLEQSTINIDLGDSRFANGLYYLNLTADGVSVSK
ncbi:MAG: T9SS type A sorting domain-containing protein, partial [Saprospiraceae bacterium]|nr:T9SS type A sorting domain-containing protein [Saprospiraceae bacterium]